MPWEQNANHNIVWPLYDENPNLQVRPSTTFGRFCFGSCNLCNLVAYRLWVKKADLCMSKRVAIMSRTAGDAGTKSA